MARLSDEDVNRLIASLGPGGLGNAQRSRGAQTTHRVADSEPPSEPGETVVDRLQALSEDGTIGRAITQRLAGYLGKPIRCTSGTQEGAAADGPLYLAKAGRLRLSVRLDPLLASALADAMIGGQGEAAKVGFGPKTVVVARAAALEMLRAIAAALGLPEPMMDDDHASPEPPLQAGGSMTLAMQEHQWQAGVARAGTESMRRPAIVSTEQQSRKRPSSAVEKAFQSASRQLAGMVGADVAFDAFAVSTLDSARVPHGWLRLGVTSRAEGAIVLAVDQNDAAQLVNASVGAQIVSGESRSALLETGAEALFGAVLLAFAQALGFTPDELHHIVRLGDDAMLADQACHGVEHVATWRDRSVRLRWLIPTMLAPDPAKLATGVRGG